MKRYIALLRGINVSGKNRIMMSELKTGFEELECEKVVTYLNSGNVVFSSSEGSENLTFKAQEMIKNKFNLEIPVFILPQEILSNTLENAPVWWGDENKEIYDNLIFLIPPLTFEQLYDAIGEPKAEYEKVFYYNNAVFWSFSRKDYQKTNWWSKTADSSISRKITIRTAGTVRKIISM